MFKKSMFKTRHLTRHLPGPTGLPTFLLLGLALALSSSSVQAQVLYGSILGKVTDPTGATVPGADVTAINQQTDITQHTLTDDVGDYKFPTLRPGSFTVKVAMPGFKESVKTDIPVTVNNITRVNVLLEVGQVTETVTVTSETAILQTDRAEVRSEVTEEKLVNLPVPLGRNYQNLFKALPGFTPPRRAHSIQTNPSRSLTFNVNGVSDSINTTRIDGAATINPWLPHITGYVPALESIQTVNVVSNSFDAEQGLAGGAAITVQLKSGTNDTHGSVFFTHHDNALRAKRFIYPYPKDLEKGKFIYNQWGGTIGGPIKEDKLFFFVSYEGTANSRFASRIASVPTPDVKNGDFSSFLPKYTIYDPLTGNPDGSGRTPFPNNVIPASRIDPVVKKFIIPLIPAPNISGRLTSQSKNYFGTGRFTWDRWTLDSKVDWNVNEKWNMFGRLSTLDYTVVQPTVFGHDGLIGDALRSHGAGGGNPGTGLGFTYNFSWGTNYIFSPNFILDANYGFAHFVTDSRNPRYGENFGSDVMGIPGANAFAEGSRQKKGGPENYAWASGFPNFEISGYNDYGNQQSYMPYWRGDDQNQYVANFTWTKGRHEIRWGLDLNRQDMNHIQAEGGVGKGSRGRFDFSKSTVRLCLKPDGAGGCKKLSKSTSRMSYASLLLGLPARVGKNFLAEYPYTTRNWLRGFYIRDRWQVTPKLTFSYGTRYEYFPIPTREDRGLERYRKEDNKIYIGGVGGVAKDMGVSVSKKMFAPRVGLAFRATDTFVMRAGYGITYDPYPLARDLRTNYPLFIEVDVRGAHSWLPAGRLADGIPVMTVPSYGNGIIDIPGNVFAFAVDDRLNRGYIQSWNLTLQKELGGGFTGEVGYVATRQIRLWGRRDLNYAEIGTGNQGRQLFAQFGRTASTRLVAPIGGSHYDSLQTRLQRRFAGGFSMDMSYVWSKVIVNGFEGDDNDSTLKINIPRFYHLNRGLASIDRTHNFEVMNIWELPVGRGRRWLADAHPFVNALLGGWQVNTILSVYSGRPFDVEAEGGLLDAPGNRQRPDVVGPIRKLGGVGPGQPYYDPAAFAAPDAPRFGTASFGLLRAPGVFNWDFGVFKKFRMTEGVNLEFRMEAFNFTNTPHLGTPEDDLESSDFLEIDGGGNEREFRFGLRLAW